MNRIIAAVLALAALLPGGFAQAQTAIDQLLENARYWESRGREDKAIEAWSKLLLARPDDAAALVTLGLHHARAGRRTEAAALLERLRAAHPGHAGIGQIEQALRVGGRADELLAEARKKARAGDAAGAVDAYRQLFGDQPPPRGLALEFYQTLGGMPGGWEEARQGMQRLVAEAPGVARFRLALAQHLTYRESTRRDGIRSLTALAGNPQVAAPAQQAWRQALLWLEATPADAPLLEAYAARFPRDADVRARLAAVRAGDAGIALQAGFRALERDEVGKAARIFQGAGRTPDALVGQAIVAMQRREFAKARALLEQVRAMVPSKPAMWEQSLRSATFWSRMQEGDAARKARRWAEARARYEEAAAVSAPDRPHVELAFGHLALEQDDAAAAEPHFRAALAARPDDPEALKGLLVSLLRTGATHEAALLNERLARLAPELAFAPAWITSEQLRGEAAEARRLGQLDKALDRLVSAAEADPTSGWALHDLANLQLELGDAPAARRTLDRLLAVAPDLREIRLVQMRILAAEGQWAAALDLLSGVPEAELDDELRSWKRRLSVRSDVAALLARNEAGDRAFVREELQAIHQQVRADPDLLAIVAEAWARLGDGARAATAVHEVLVRGGDVSTGRKLQLAAILFEAGRDAELVGLLREVASANLSVAERKHLQALRIGYAIRVADRLREQEAFERAFSHLSPVVQEYPDDPRLLCAVARLYRSAGQEREAHAVYLRVLRDDPDDFPARQGAVETAVALQLTEEAQTLAREGLRRAPKDPRAHLVAARMSIATGDPGEGMDALRRAEVLATSTGGLADPYVGEAGPELTAASTNAEILRSASLRFLQPRGPRSADGRQQILGEIEREMDALQSRLAVRASAAPQLRFRDGEEGFGQLTVLSVPFEVRIPLGYSAQLGLHVTPLSIAAGPLAVGDPGVLARFGTGGSFREEDFAGSVGGTAVAASYRSGGLVVDVGSSPLGFPAQTPVGGLAYAWEEDGVGIKLDLERRNVEDSVLSWAGMRDPATGRVWGAVVRNGGRLDLGLRSPGQLLYLYGGYHLLTGVDVEDNRFAEAGLGAAWGLYDDGTSEVSLGMGLGALSYAKNQRYFTRGHGGYFSPQAFVRAGVPLRWKGATGRLQWDVLVDPGVNWFQEDAARLFPADPDLQAQAEAALAPDGTPATGNYPARTSVAFSLDAQPRLALRMGDFLTAGLQAELHAADDYREVSGGLFVEGSFQRRRR